MAERYDLYQATASALLQSGPRRESTEQQAIARVKDARASAEVHHDRVRVTCREHQEARNEAEKGVGELLAARPLKRLRRAIGTMVGCDAGAAVTMGPGYLETLREGYEGSRARIEQLADVYVALTKRYDEILGISMSVLACLLIYFGLINNNSYIFVPGLIIIGISVINLIRIYNDS